eukprot:scaffold7044_cov216-Pinguiococcus_pyrenoidosus.AAC.13
MILCLKSQQAKGHPMVILDASVELQQDWDFILAAAMEHGNVLTFVSRNLWEDREFVRLRLRKSGPRVVRPGDAARRSRRGMTMSGAIIKCVSVGGKSFFFIT